MMDGFLNSFGRCSPVMLVVEEVHYISQWGHYFRPEYRVLVQLKQRFSAMPVIAVNCHRLRIYTRRYRTPAGVAQAVGTGQQL